MAAGDDHLKTHALRPARHRHAVRLSKATVRKMKQNLAWASVYNLLAIPVAAGAFYSSLGWSLRPEISALLMSASSIVVLNAVSLRRAKMLKACPRPRRTELGACCAVGAAPELASDLGRGG